MGVGILSGIGAKELVVSTMGVMFSAEDEVTVPESDDLGETTPAHVHNTYEEQSGDTRLQKALQKSVTPAGALSFMVFVLLYFLCIATFVAIKQESGGWKWAIFSAIYTVVLAWTMAFMTYRIALLF